jgi:hypothetical protein
VCQVAEQSDRMRTEFPGIFLMRHDFGSFSRIGGVGWAFSFPSFSWQVFSILGHGQEEGL